MRQHVESQSHLTVFARAQGRADRGEEGSNYDAVSDDEGEGRVSNEEEMGRGVRELLGDPGRYRLYVPERWESEDGEDYEGERITNGLSVRGWRQP